MMIDTQQFQAEIEKLLNEEMIGPEKLADMAGISRGTIYRILSGGSKMTQRETVKRIAEATNREIVVSGGNQIQFVKKPKEEKHGEYRELTPEEEELLNLYRAMSQEKKDAFIRLLLPLS